MFFVCSRFRSYVLFGSLFVVLWLPLATLLGPLAHHLDPLAHHLDPLGLPVGFLRAFWGALGLPSGRPLAALTLLYAHLGGPLPQWTPLGPPRASFWIDFGSNLSKCSTMWPCFPIFVNELFSSSLLRSHLFAHIYQHGSAECAERLNNKKLYFSIFLSCIENI